MSVGPIAHEQTDGAMRVGAALEVIHDQGGLRRVVDVEPGGRPRHFDPQVRPLTRHKIHIGFISPGRYESYVDLVPGEWTHLRIEVSGATARLYVNNAAQPALIVNDLKRGADAHGTVGLFVGNGTDGHFRNLTVRPQ